MTTIHYARMLPFADLADADVGIARNIIPEPARQFIFLRRKSGAAWFYGERERLSVFRAFRPTNNALPGYEPSGARRRWEADE